MNIQLFSDLHLEFASFVPQLEQADVAVFAGDIEIGSKGIKWLNSLAFEKPILYVLGNHEYYKNTYPKLIAEAKSAITRSNIHLLEDEHITLDGINFHGCTLWTNFALFGDPKIAGFECQQVMTDYKKIRKLPGYSKLRALDTALIHQASLHKLSTDLKNCTGTNVVITHHAPSLKSAPKQYQNTIITAAYASNLEDFINRHNVSLWLHGHMHNSSDYYLGNCRVVCNPRSYKGEFNPAFEAEKLIALS